LCLFVIFNISKHRKRSVQTQHHQFFFQLQHLYSSTQQIRHGLESLRHTFQLQIVAGRSHCCLCSLCLPCTHQLQ
jgi:hypothetical protein